MTRAIRTVRRLIDDCTGATILEFAIIAPLLCALLMGGFDIAYQQYARSVLDGEVAKAARDSALESGSSTTTQTAIDNNVRASLLALAQQGTVTFTRRSFSSYARVASPAEPFIDADGDGLCNNGEAYEDSNRNGSFDLTDASVSGFSGAKDQIVYTATLTYPRLLPLGHLLGWGDTVTVSASTVLTIQPFDNKAAVQQRTCA